MADPPESTKPLDATRHVDTATGALSYSEVSERLALHIVECLEDILTAAPDDIRITPDWITNIHRRVAGELFPEWAGKFRITDVRVGTHAPPPFFDVPVHIHNFCLDLQQRRLTTEGVESIAELLAWVDWRFQWIHPFKDFNGRVGRILLTALLYSLKLPPLDPAPVEPSAKANYLAALRAADAGDIRPLANLWIERLAGTDGE